MKHVVEAEPVYYLANFTYDCKDEKDKEKNLLCPAINENIRDKLVLHNS